MDNPSNSPEAADAASAPNEAESPRVSLTTYATRHDGWTGEKMARFCEVLAETAVVAEACDQAGMGLSGAYAARRRNPVFAAAWDAALTIARERLADTLLARSMEGNIEQIWKDGELVGERHVLDNRLGLAILRRLDRLAETGMTVSNRGVPSPAFVRPERSRGAPAPRSQPFDWERMVHALETGDPDDIAEALALIGGKGDKVDEVEGPPNPLGHGDNGSDEDEENEAEDLSARCWTQDESGEKVWMTDFPPPAGFKGYENTPYDELKECDCYERECTPEERAVLEAVEASDRAADRAEDEKVRDSWFEALKKAAEAETPSAGEQSQSECEPASKSCRGSASGSQSEPD